MYLRNSSPTRSSPPVCHGQRRFQFLHRRVQCVNHFWFLAGVVKRLITFRDPLMGHPSTKHGLETFWVFRFTPHMIYYLTCWKVISYHEYCQSRSCSSISQTIWINLLFVGGDGESNIKCLWLLCHNVHLVTLVQGRWNVLVVDDV